MAGRTTAAQAAVLRRHFGEPPVAEHKETPPGGDQTALVAAIGDLVSQMRTLVTLAVEREARIEALEVDVRALRALVRSNHPTQDGEESQVQPVPRGTTE